MASTPTLEKAVSNISEELSPVSTTTSPMAPRAVVADEYDEREPEELLDPITLTIMEEAVMAPECGHSFSKASIVNWLATAPRPVCPVCKTAVSSKNLVPNWALRTGVDRYMTRYGKRKVDADENDIEKGEGQPSAPPIEELMKPGAHRTSSEAEDPIKPTQTQTSSSGTVQPSAPAGVPEEPRSFLCIDIPPGDNSCLHYECATCGVCRNSTCSKASLIFCPATSILSNLSFGKWSSWYSRTICGVLFPIYIVLIVACFGFDMIIWISVFFTLIGLLALLLLPLVLLFQFVAPQSGAEDNNEGSQNESSE